MENRIFPFSSDSERQEEQDDGPLPLGEVLTELLAQYQVRFLDVRIEIVKTPSATI